MIKNILLLYSYLPKRIIMINFFIFIILFLLLDFILSNTIFNANKNSCYQIEKFFYSLKKNCSGFDKFKSSFPTVKVLTDNEGLRIGKNTKRNNQEKIFIFGDSFTFGVGLEYEKTFSGILENKFRENSFYNFAVGSYSPTVHLFNLEKQINLGNFPKKIILLLDMTDVNDEAARWRINNGKPELLNSKHYDEFYKKKKFFHKNFTISRRFIHFMNYQTRILRSQINPKNEDYLKTSLQAGFTYRELNELGDHYKNDIFNLGLDKIKKKISHISDISKKIDSEFYLVIYPYAETLVYGQQKFNWENFANEICTNNNCKLINAFNIFREYKNNNIKWYSDLFFIADEHFNAGGNKLLAEEIINKIFIK